MLGNVEPKAVSRKVEAITCTGVQQVLPEKSISLLAPLGAKSGPLVYASLMVSHQRGKLPEPFLYLS
jgi:hypothetical protein